ncbi:MAG: glutamate--tRNA ligase, partial [Pseudomonadota bacterium]
LHDLKSWWVMLRDGAEPLIEDEDREFVAEAMAMLPEELGPETWSEWTAEVKAKTGRKGKGLFQPLRKALTGQTSGPDMGAFLPLMQVIRARG